MILSKKMAEETILLGTVFFPINFVLMSYFHMASKYQNTLLHVNIYVSWTRRTFCFPCPFMGSILQMVSIS
jgi:hypothetical protein